MTEELPDLLFILDEHGDPIIERDIKVWTMWLKKATMNGDRIVKQTTLGYVIVSTMFTGIDRRSEMRGPPILYGTTIFGGKYGLFQYQVGSATKHAALSDHDEAVEIVKNSQRGWLIKLWYRIRGI